jgi:NRAMP (natural resistance-associated macrophage protein)-like metal ion transporter
MSGVVSDPVEKKTLDNGSSKRRRAALPLALGPGLTTGAADDDPGGIATHSQAGARFGFDLLWTAFLTTPLMIAIQLVSARIGYATGRGIAANALLLIPRPAVAALVFLLVAATTFNIGADIAAMGEVMALVAGGSQGLYALLFGAGSLLLQTFVPYHRYAPILKWLTLVLLAYVAAAFSVSVPWGEVGVALIVPTLHFSSDYLFMVVAIFGTTISPYMFFWHAAQEVEERRRLGRGNRPAHAPRRAARDLKTMLVDTSIGMILANVIALFIMVTAAATLHSQGVTDIATASEAAEALRPIAGDLTFFLFALGIVGTGLLAIPVLAGASAYAVSDLFGWRSSLEDRPEQDKGFYAMIAGGMAAGVALSFLPIEPMRLLVWSALANGITAFPLMVAMMRIATSRRAMGVLRVGPVIAAGGWLATISMGLLVLVLGLSAL